jgi:hypothetical protein
MKTHCFRGVTDTQAIAIQEQINKNGRDERMLAYHYARTPEEWWQIVEDWWIELLKIAWRYLDAREITEPDFQPLHLQVEIWKKEKNPELLSFFSRVWWMAPDNGSIHANKGWNVLCDLCSEGGGLLSPEPDGLAQ